MWVENVCLTFSAPAWASPLPALLPETACLSFLQSVSLRVPPAGLKCKTEVGCSRGPVESGCGGSRGEAGSRSRVALADGTLG